MADGIFGVGSPLGPIAPGLPGMVNPLALLGAGMYQGNPLGALQAMAGIQQQARQQQLNEALVRHQLGAPARQAAQMQAIRERLTQPVEVPAAGPPAPGQPHPTRMETPTLSPQMEIALMLGPQAVQQHLQRMSAVQEQWETLEPSEAADMGFKPGAVVQRSTTTGQLRVPGTGGVQITNVPAPSAGYEYFQTPEGTLQARAIPHGPATRPTEKQQDVAAYVQNAEAASSVLESVGKDVSPTQVAAAGNPVTRLVTSDEAKRAYDAQLAWTWAVLRAESGATVTREEAQNALNIYFERPGDTEQNREDKRKLRETKERTMRERAASALEAPSTQGYKIVGYE